MKQMLQRWLRRVADPSAADRRLVEQVLELADEQWKRIPSQLASEYDTLCRSVHAGNRLENVQILVPLLSLVATAIRRVLGISPYPVQVLAGLALARGEIAEMHTGEGKTLATAFPAALFSLAGSGVHVMTVNAYLAERDYGILHPVFASLGVEAGLLRTGDDLASRRRAYSCPITFGPGYEFGFDYLRDQLSLLQQDKAQVGVQTALARESSTAPTDVHDIGSEQTKGNSASRSWMRQRGHTFAIIDEADSVLIDEAGTPLIISDQAPTPHRHPEPYLTAQRLAASLRRDEDYSINPRMGIRWSPEARRQIADYWKSLSARSPLQRPWQQYVDQAVYALHVLRRDADYVVDDDGRVCLVDQDTGRVFADRSWQSGLHQAVEAKERVAITEESHSAARISRQRYFRLYDRLCGLTGTAASAAREFNDVYGLTVTMIPLRTPSRRVVELTRFFATDDHKWRAVVADVQQRRRRGQPVLIGTGTIHQSEELARRFVETQVPFQLLNGRQTQDEAEIIAQAGSRGELTIATNMAGRGTDIRLGHGVAELGGLHVIGTEHHESQRVDRQLIGRCARQGDPGSCQFFVSAEDRLIKRHGSVLARQMQRLVQDDGEIRTDLSMQFRSVQIQAERASRLRRYEVAQYDDWLTDLVAKLS